MVCFFAKNRRRFSAFLIATMCLLSIVGRVDDLPRPSANDSVVIMAGPATAVEHDPELFGGEPKLECGDTHDVEQQGGGVSPEGIFAY